METFKVSYEGPDKVCTVKVTGRVTFNNEFVYVSDPANNTIKLLVPTHRLIDVVAV